MKKLLLFIIAVSVFSPCSVPAADGADTPFQIAKSYKLMKFEKQDFYGKDRLLNNRPDGTGEIGGSTEKSVRSCPAGKYRKSGGTCVSFCSGIRCTTGTPTVVAGGCCCQ